jgi:hypothetical protein
VKLTLNRNPSGVSCTIGDLLVDGEFLCHTLEDVIREVEGQPVEAWKVPGRTAIPAGDYAFEITYSKRFQRDVPRLIDVPGFTYIEIHPGNTDADTAGCILVGQWLGGEQIANSRKAFEALMDVLEIANIAKQTLSIEVCNP